MWKKNWGEVIFGGKIQFGEEDKEISKWGIILQLTNLSITINKLIQRSTRRLFNLRDRYHFKGIFHQAYPFTTVLLSSNFQSVPILVIFRAFFALVRFCLFSPQFATIVNTHSTHPPFLAYYPSKQYSIVPTSQSRPKNCPISNFPFQQLFQIASILHAVH